MASPLPILAGLRPLVGRALVAAADRLRVPLTMEAAPDRWGGYRTIETTGRAKGLTPARVAQYLQDAAEGYPASLCELLDEIEDRDLHVLGVLGVRKRAVANLAWEITAPANDGRRQSRRIAEFCTERLQEIADLEGMYLDLLDAVSKGYAAVELEWYNRGGVAGITRHHYRPQRWFRPADADPEIWRLLDAQNPTEGIPLTPYRFVVHVARAKSGFPTSAGLGRAMVWWYLFKNYAIKDWVSYAELFGAPLRLGKYPAGAKPADIDALHIALQKLGVDAAAAIPADMQVEFVGASRSAAAGGAEVYEKLAAFCDKAISKGVLGQTLTTEASERGTQALGRVHDDVRQDLKVADALQLARTLRSQLLAPLVAFNFGPDAPVPAISFDVAPPADDKAEAEVQTKRAEVFAAARKLGVAVSIAQVREELALREPVGDEPVLSAPGEGAAPAPTPESTRATGRVAAPGALAGADRGDVPAFLAEAEARIQRVLDEGGHVEAWRPFMDRLRTELGEVRDLGDLPSRFEGLLVEMNLGALEPQLSSVLLTGELVGRLHVASGDLAVGGIPQLPPTEAADWWLSRKVVPREEFYALAEEARSQAWTISKWTSASALAEAHQLMEQVIRSGGTIADFEDGLDAVYQRAGLSPLSPHRLETVFRNGWTTAYSVGRTHEQMAPERLRRRPLGRYCTMDDKRVRPTHADQDGKVYPLDHDFWSVWNPPNGHMCRCYRTAHSEEEVRTAGWRQFDELPTDAATGRPVLPDEGFRRDPAREPHQFDWSRFPAPWQAILEVNA